MRLMCVRRKSIARLELSDPSMATRILCISDPRVGEPVDKLGNLLAEANVDVLNGGLGVFHRILGKARVPDGES
jgi:hypothetical protein